MYQVIQKRWIRWSSDDNNNLEVVVWTGNSIKQARGEVKAKTNSIRDAMESHDWKDGQRIDSDKGILQYWDDEGVWFEQTYEIREIS
jgi:hypothetical protein